MTGCIKKLALVGVRITAQVLLGKKSRYGSVFSVPSMLPQTATPRKKPLPKASLLQQGFLPKSTRAVDLQSRIALKRIKEETPKPTVFRFRRFYCSHEAILVRKFSGISVVLLPEAIVTYCELGRKRHLGRKFTINSFPCVLRRMTADAHIQDIQREPSCPLRGGHSCGTPT